MSVGHNLTCVSMLTLAAGGSSEAPPMWGPAATPLEALAISVITSFQRGFPCIIW